MNMPSSSAKENATVEGKSEKESKIQDESHKSETTILIKLLWLIQM